MRFKRGLGSFADRTEEFHLLFDFGFDGLNAWLEDLTWIEAFLFVGGTWVGFAFSAVLDGSGGED